jgi:predicted nuclease with TOPRIM domain
MEADARERYAYGRHQEVQKEFEGVQNELATLYRLLRADMDATNDAVDLRARALAEIAGSSEAMLEQLAELRGAVDELSSRLAAQRQHDDRLEERRASDAP